MRSNAGQPEVTVIIPTYARADVIGPTLAGALGQEGIDHEVIAVDDCSPDDTSDRLRRVSDPRLRTLTQSTNGGVARARNWGIEEARGKWIAFLDDDDYWSPSKLREQVDAAATEQADLVYSCVAMIDKQFKLLAYVNPPEVGDQPRAILERSAVPAGASNAIVRADLVREVGGFDESLGPLADWDLFARLILGGRHSVSMECHVGYVFHSGNMSGDNLAQHTTDFEIIEAKYRSERERVGAKLNGALYWHWMAGGLRRSGNRRDAARVYLKSATRYPSLRNMYRLVGLALDGNLRKSRAPTYDLGPPPEWLDLYRRGGRFDRTVDEL